MLAEITHPKLGASDFLSKYRDATGRSFKEYLLPRDLTVTLILGYRADLRYRVVKRHDSVKHSIEALAEHGVFVRPQSEDEESKDAMGRRIFVQPPTGDEQEVATTTNGGRA
ncbi:hypothetical protein [Rhodobaculum claviforme]|uniref:Uncharacterized protein n=1 Tax=Rhodobaculum claviforme TaxID=1549854 RepID=A0A934WGS6_9RHOB|nr:hypothetical protein [Rhodobaculum claviforme]MBK5927090.1 hypothetical protein [Rhodobaculum claviforme]